MHLGCTTEKTRDLEHKSRIQLKCKKCTFIKISNPDVCLNESCNHRLNRCGRLPNKKSKLGGCPMPDGNIYQVRSCTIFMGIFSIHDSHNIWGAETPVNELNCCHSFFLQQGCRNSHKRTTQKSILLSSLDLHLNLAISLVFSFQHGSRKK